MFKFSNFQFIPNCHKLWHLKKKFFLLLHTACYLTCVTSIALTIHVRHTHSLFAMKCITMCSDMNNLHFKHRFIYTNNISLIQILFKVNMRYFFLSVYKMKNYGKKRDSNSQPVDCAATTITVRLSDVIQY